MKQFLRFQISGITCLFWLLALVAASVGFDQVTWDAKVVTAGLVAALGISLAVGVLIHEVTISLLSPFRERRPFKLPQRRFPAEAKALLPPHFNLSDETAQVVSVLARAVSSECSIELSRSSDVPEDSGDTLVTKRSFDTAFIREEISNRYSYYYVRVENGAFAPVMALGVFALLKIAPGLDMPGEIGVRVLLIVALMGAVAVAVLYYIPQLLRELDDLERVLLTMRGSAVSAALGGASVEGGINKALNMPGGYFVTGRFSRGECSALTADIASFVETASTLENLQMRKAYPPDHAKNRRSCAFSIMACPTPETRDLPALGLDELPASLRDLTLRVVAQLGVRAGRVLFNVQKYRSGSEPVPAHFDGEYFELSKDEFGLQIYEAIRPRFVALMTMRDVSSNGATILVPDSGGEERRVATGAGDLLIFDNLWYTHRVDSIVATQRVDTDWDRYVIGWRALDDGCFLYRNGLHKRLTLMQAVERHKSFLRTWTYDMRAPVPF